MAELPSNWHSLRRERLERDGYTCANCSAKGGPNGGATLHVHHIVPRKDGGSNDVENLKTLCKDCHDAIHHTDKTAPTGQVSKQEEDPLRHFGLEDLVDAEEEAATEESEEQNRADDVFAAFDFG